mmetsp:Transcript_72448/g.209741  ORF Transcript_72448/g.209741 Transcript_72448/m.209741 type:complete len:200 (+) Transcript_72448:342-941(+)
MMGAAATWNGNLPPDGDEGAAAVVVMVTTCGAAANEPLLMCGPACAMVIDLDGSATWYTCCGRAIIRAGEGDELNNPCCCCCCCCWRDSLRRFTSWLKLSISAFFSRSCCWRAATSAAAFCRSSASSAPTSIGSAGVVCCASAASICSRRTSRSVMPLISATSSVLRTSYSRTSPSKFCFSCLRPATAASNSTARASAI